MLKNPPDFWYQQSLVLEIKFPLASLYLKNIGVENIV